MPCRADAGPRIRHPSAAPCRRRGNRHRERVTTVLDLRDDGTRVGRLRPPRRGPLARLGGMVTLASEGGHRGNVASATWSSQIPSSAGRGRASGEVAPAPRASEGSAGGSASGRAVAASVRGFRDEERQGSSKPPGARPERVVRAYVSCPRPWSSIAVTRRTTSSGFSRPRGFDLDGAHLARRGRPRIVVARCAGRLGARSQLSCSAPMRRARSQRRPIRLCRPRPPAVSSAPTRRRLRVCNRRGPTS
jgi:hypothetical protein